MPSFRKFGRIFLNYKQVELILAEVVHVGKNYSYKRQIDAVDKRLVEETIQTVTDAVSGSVLQSGLSVDQKEKTKVCHHTSKQSYLWMSCLDCNFSRRFDASRAKFSWMMLTSETNRKFASRMNVIQGY